MKSQLFLVWFPSCFWFELINLTLAWNNPKNIPLANPNKGASPGSVAHTLLYSAMTSPCSPSRYALYSSRTVSNKLISLSLLALLSYGLPSNTLMGQFNKNHNIWVSGFQNIDDSINRLEILQWTPN